MKRFSLRLRLTLLSSILLTIACICLTFIINLSAEKLIDAIDIMPALTITESLPLTPIAYEAEKQTFRAESMYAMIAIIFLGSAITYIVVGKALVPVKELTECAKNKDVNTLSEQIALPKIQDEVYDLTVAFNDMSSYLENLFALQKQFSSDVAHEFRTPLASMQAKLEVYKLTNSSDSKLADELLQQIERLSKLIDDLLWFSKDTPLDNITRVDITQLINDIKEELSEQAQTKQVNILVEEKPFYIKGNDALLERVFYNLLQNAVKYTEENTLINVTFNQENSTVFICDKGIGIADEEKLSVFEPFYRVDKSRSRLVGGNGLGLAICKKILKKHNATIKITDNIPQGTIFEIQFLS